MTNNSQALCSIFLAVTDFYQLHKYVIIQMGSHLPSRQKCPAVEVCRFIYQDEAKTPCFPPADTTLGSQELTKPQRVDIIKGIL